MPHLLSRRSPIPVMILLLLPVPAAAQEATPVAAEIEREVVLDASVALASRHTLLTFERWTFRPGSAVVTEEGFPATLLLAMQRGSLAVNDQDQTPALT